MPLNEKRERMMFIKKQMNNALLMRCTLVFGLAVAWLGGQDVWAKELKFSHFVSPQHVMHAEIFAPWAETVKKQSNGELTVRIFPAMQLGGTPPGLLDQVRNNVSDLAWSVAGYNAAQFPRTMMLELPGLTESPNHLTKMMYALYDPYLKDDFRDLHPLVFWSNDSLVLMTREKPIRSLQDLKGLKIRVASAGQTELIAALGGVAVSMPVTQMYTALERGVVDGVMLGASGIFDFRLDEVARYFTINAPLGRSPFYIAMNKDVYAGLSAEHRKIIDETTGSELGMKAGEAYELHGKKALEQLRKSGKHEVIALSAEENLIWRKTVEPVLERWVENANKAGVPGREMLQKAQTITP
jgi:TRAP-type transport system periplasmic protein